MKTHLLKAAIVAALASGAAYAAQPDKLVNPYSPAYGHPYRHGVLPTLNVQAAMRRWQQAHAQVDNSPTLSYNGGISGQGVMSGQNKVYIVFYGTQWGTSSTDANGDLAFTNDASHAASAAQEFFKGIGNNGETWSNDLTQWCDGAAIGATSCGAGLTRIPRQQNILAGVWYDNTQASPAAASQTQLGNEAIAAALHFGNTAAGSNRSTYYVIISPTGTNPDNYQGNYCAWHSWTSSSYGNIAYSNQPYNIDSGFGCGVDFINSGSAGTLDGWTMTLGHEWHEMMSDQFPSSAWFNTNTGTYQGQENSDECAWISAGSAGGAAMVAFGTGTFAEQASWSNDTNSCSISHPDVSSGKSIPTANFSYSAIGTTANFTDGSSEAGGTIASHAWDFGDGATSTATNPSHAYATVGTYNVKETVTDGLGATAAKTSAVNLGTLPSEQLVKNTGFENTASWTGTTSRICPTGCAGEVAHTGVGFAWLDGTGTAHTDTLSQKVTIPYGHLTATLRFYLHVDSAEPSKSVHNDKLYVRLYNGSTILTTLATYSNANTSSGYVLKALDVTPYIGQTVFLKFLGTENGSAQTSFVIDNVTLTAN